MKRLVFPGEEVGSEIEFLPGKNVVGDGEILRATTLGELAVENKKISVIPKKNVPTILRPGVLVFGRVEEIFDPIALVRVEGIEGGGVKPVSNAYYCVLHVSNIKKGFVENIRNELRIGDVIKAEVCEIRGEDVMLSIKKDGLGVVKAFCSKCRQPLELSGKTLSCPSCGNKEARKLGFPYRSL